MAGSTAVMERPGPRANADMVEKVLLGGDLSTLTAEERLTYYKQLCESLGLNPLSRPFEYHDFKGKRVLYARKDATEQLRRIHDVSIGKLDILYADDLVMVTVEAHLPNGRSDMDAGGVPIKGLQGEDRVNAVLKAVTKAKRRVTLSICGLGMLDETEIESNEQAASSPRRSAGVDIRDERADTTSEPAEAAEYRKLDALLEQDPEAAEKFRTWLKGKGWSVNDLTLNDVRKTIKGLEERATNRVIDGQPVDDAQGAEEEADTEQAEEDHEPEPEGAAPTHLQVLNGLVDRATVWLEQKPDARNGTEGTSIMGAFRTALGPAFVAPATASGEAIAVAMRKNNAKAAMQLASAEDIPF